MEGDGFGMIQVCYIYCALYFYYYYSGFISDHQASDPGRKLQAYRAELANGLQHLMSISGVCCLNCCVEKSFEDGGGVLE